MMDPQELFEKPEHKERFNHFVTNPTLPSATERDRVLQAVEQEHEWWKDVPDYATEEDIARDVERGALVLVESNENFKTIMRLRNPDLQNWQPYLTKNAREVLHEVARRWRALANDYGVASTIFLSVTNLTVSERYRKEILKKGNLATGKSSHTKGESFDIDGSGYYQGDDPINPRLTEDYDERYNVAVHGILNHVLEEMRSEGKIDFIVEFPGTGNQSFHITRNPAYAPCE